MQTIYLTDIVRVVSRDQSSIEIIVKKTINGVAYLFTVTVSDRVTRIWCDESQDIDLRLAAVELAADIVLSETFVIAARKLR